MIDTVQAILIFVIVILTILLIVLGIQVFFILRDVRGTLKRVNRVLDNAEVITEGITQPVTFLTNLLGASGSMAFITKIIKLIRTKE